MRPTDYVRANGRIRPISVPRPPIWLSRNWMFRANWWRGLRAHSGHPTGSTSTSERAVRALRFSGLSSQIRIG